MMRMSFLVRPMGVLLTISLAFGLVGCGLLTDKDRIRVAKIGDTYITRGDLAQYLRNLPDDQRPTIATRGDLGHALRKMVDKRILEPVAAKLESEGKISVSREAAEQRFYQVYPDLRMKIGNPQDFNMTEDDVKAMEEQKEYGIDRVRRELLSDAAVAYLARQGHDDGSIKVTSEELSQAYEFRKGELRTLESVAFMGLGFPTANSDARAAAATAKQRLDSKEPVDALIQEYSQKGIGFPMNSAIENNPSVERFKGFWQQATGAQVGDVVGPVFIPGMQAVGVDESGKQVSRKLPEMYLVAVITESHPAREKTVEEAQQELAPDVVIPKVMKKLYEEHRVEFFESKLPDPAFYKSSGGN